MASLENPFAPAPPLKHDDAGYIEAALGKEDAELFRSIDDETKKKKKIEPPRGSLELTVEEKKLVETEKIERKERAENIWTKQQYIEWAESFGKDAKWVDKTFTFHQDGTTSVEKDLYLGQRGTSILPKGFKRVNGTLVLSYNQLTSLEGLPQEITGSLYLSYNQLTSLEGLPKEIRGELSLSNNQLTSLEGLPQKIKADLSLKGNPIRTDFPDGVSVGGMVYVDPTQTQLIASLKKKGIKFEIRK